MTKLLICGALMLLLCACPMCRWDEAVEITVDNRTDRIITVLITAAGIEPDTSVYYSSTQTRGCLQPYKTGVIMFDEDDYKQIEGFCFRVYSQNLETKSEFDSLLAEMVYSAKELEDLNKTVVYMEE